MLYRNCGKTREKVSVLGFGCMRLPVLPGGDFSRIDEPAATRIIRHAIDVGVNYVDTAYPYHGTTMGSGGQSEPFVGRALQDGYRQKVHLATKLPSWLIQAHADMDRYLNEQLTRLQTDHIDFYLVHGLRRAWWEQLKAAGFADFLDKALKDGRIRHAGFSYHEQPEMFKEVVDAYDWSFCQIQYNYMDEKFQAGRRGLEYAAKKGLGIVIMEPLKGGKLAQNLPAEVSRELEHSGKSWSPAEWALRWVWDHPEVSLALSGMNSMEQITENLRIANEALPNSLTGRDLQTVEHVKAVFATRTKVPCTECGYCQPCPEGVNIPGCFSFFNDYHVFGRREEGMYHRFLAPQQRASNCSACGTCETQCPQAIPIRRELKEVAAVFEPAAVKK
jgi:predicted aldo/keto reductase-like oxidoreductase